MQDLVLPQVYGYTLHGWPNSLRSLPGNLKPFFNKRFQITIANKCLDKFLLCHVKPSPTMVHRLLQLLFTTLVKVEAYSTPRLHPTVPDQMVKLKGLYRLSKMQDWPSYQFRTSRNYCWFLSQVQINTSFYYKSGTIRNAKQLSNENFLICYTLATVKLLSHSNNRKLVMMFIPGQTSLKLVTWFGNAI